MLKFDNIYFIYYYKTHYSIYEKMKWFSLDDKISLQNEQ